MREVWERHKNKSIYIRDVKNTVWPVLRSSDIPSNSTESSIIKRELKMSYHLLEKKHRKATLEEGVRKFIQAFALQIELNKSEIELIFIDEISFLQENRMFKGWAKKESKAYVVEGFKDLHMSFIVSFSSRHFYWIKVNSDTNDLYTFVRFLKETIEIRK